MHQGAFTQERLDERMAQGEGHPFPWLLAAQVLGGHRQALNWGELWDVIRCYAHNRGYDGNALWSSGFAEESDDTKREENANRLMQAHGTSTMAETVCAFLGVDPGSSAAPKLEAYFKGNDAAFSRSVVHAEVLRILRVHTGVLEGCDEAFITCLCGEGKADWQAVPCPSIGLPQRYHGGLLFGQMVPRFDNRIIPLCRISGEKAPDKHCREFYRYRWGMLLSNIRVMDIGGEVSRRLTGKERQTIHETMQKEGYLTKHTLQKALHESVKAEPTNIEALFLTPEMERALLFDPVKKITTSDCYSGVWEALSAKLQKVFDGQLFRGKLASIKLWRAALEAEGQDTSAFDSAAQEAYDVYLKRARKKAHPPEVFIGGGGDRYRSGQRLCALFA